MSFEGKIDLSGIKVVIFDFDGTLAIHKDPSYIQNREKSEDIRLGYYLNAYRNPETFYEDIEPCVSSEALRNFVNDSRNKGIKMYCLSAMKFSFHLKAKQSFVSKHYGDDIKVISTASQELKLDGIKIIQRINGCNLDEILFIEDMDTTIEYLRSNGIRVVDVNAMNTEAV